MKRTVKKIELRRDTLLALDREDLEKVAGGVTTRCTNNLINSCVTCPTTCNSTVC